MFFAWYSHKEALVEGLDPQQIFGGAVLLFVLGLLLAGKLRLEREVKAKDEVIAIKDDTIAQHVATIERLTASDRVTLHLLQEIRDQSIRNEGGHH